MRSRGAFLAGAIVAAAVLAGCEGGGEVYVDGGPGGGTEVEVVVDVGGGGGGAGAAGLGTLGTANGAVTLAVVELYVVETWEPDWGYDWLWGEVVLPGEVFDIPGLPEGFYDALAVFEDGSWAVEYDLEIVGGGLTEWVAELGTLAVVNLSSSYVDELYVVPYDSPDWGYDLLDGDWLGPDEEIEIVDLPEGWYDAWAVLDEGANDVVEYDIYVTNGAATVWEVWDY